MPCACQGHDKIQCDLDSLHAQATAMMSKISRRVNRHVVEKPSHWPWLLTGMQVRLDGVADRAQLKHDSIPQSRFSTRSTLPSHRSGTVSVCELHRQTHLRNGVQLPSSLAAGDPKLCSRSARLEKSGGDGKIAAAQQTPPRASAYCLEVNSDLDRLQSSVSKDPRDKRSDHGC